MYSSEAEVEMDRRCWEQRNADIALCETNRDLQSQRLEPYQAKPMGRSSSRRNRRLSGEPSTKNNIYQEHHARDCQEIEELRSICCKQADRVRQLRFNELSVQQENPSTVNQLLSKLQELQDRVNSLNGEKEFYDLATASSSGTSRVPRPSRSPSPRRMIKPRFLFAAQYTELDGHLTKRS